MFGDLFDFNHDGKLDGFERAAEFATFASMIDDCERDLDDEYDEDEDEYYRVVTSPSGRCPFYRQGDDYTLARKQ